MIYHWCARQDWEGAHDPYTAPSLEAEGFIHFSFLDQVERTASQWNAGQPDLVLLAVNPEGLPLVVEDSYEVGEEYPHIYGPLPFRAVAGVFAFPPEEDGTFRLPPGLPT